MQVPGNLVISAHSGAHSFDASQMNMSHVISHFSFGRMITPKVMNDVKRLVPYLGGSHDRLNGRSFINHRDLGANVTVSLSLYTSWHCVCFSIVLCLSISISMFK